MAEDLWAFTRALWGHTKVLLTGGSVAAVVAVWVLSGNKVWPLVGVTIVAYAFFVASFEAWRDERRQRAIQMTASAARVRELEQQLDDIRQLDPKMIIGGVQANASLPQYFSVYLTFENPGEKASIRPEVQAIVTSDGREPVVFMGRLSPGAPHALEAGQQSAIYSQFDYDARLPNRESLQGAMIEVIARDLRNRVIRAPYGPIQLS